MNPLRLGMLAFMLLVQVTPPQQPQTPPPPDPEAQSREEIRRRLEEQERQRLEEQRRRSMDFLRDSTGTVPSPLPRSSQPFITPIMQHNAEFDLTSIPLKDWLEAEEENIPWKVDVKDSALRIDQRLEVAYSAKIQAKDLNKLGKTHELFFISGVSNEDGTWMAEPKVVRQKLEDEIPEQVEVRFTDYVFAQPGKFSLWLVLYDRETGKHSVDKRPVEVSELENDPLPRAAMHLPPVEFPKLSDREGGSVLEFYGGLLLPVENKRPVQIDLISILSPPEQWSGRHSVIRSHNEATVAVLNALSQMQLSQGSMSVTGLDIVQRTQLFEQKDYTRLDWAGLASAFKTIKHNTVSAATLQAKGGAAFFRDMMNEKLTGSRSAMRVFVVVSSSLVFGQGADRDPIKLQGDCHCRVYHLRFRHNFNDVFDDLERLMRPFRPKTYNISVPRDFRKALAEIMKDLASL